MSAEKGPFSPGLMIGIVAAGILSFAAFVFLLGWGGDNGVRSRERATAVSRSAIGLQALYRITSRYFDAELLRDAMLLETTDLVVITLEPRNTRAEVEALLNRRPNAPTVIVLPKWMVAPDPERSGWVRSVGPEFGDEGARLLGGNLSVEALAADARPPAFARGTDLLQGIEVPVPTRPQVIRGNDVEPLIAIPGEGALVARLGDRPHYVVADPDLVNNHGLRDAARARAAVQILGQLRPDYQEDEEDGTIRFDLTLNGVGGGRSILRSMFEPPFLALTLALIAAALLAGYHGAVRFGPARRPARAIPFGKAALVENSAGLIRLARREVRLGGAYADVVRDDAARAGAAPANLRDEALEAYLDRFTRPGEPPFSQLAYAMRTARDRGELMAAARALFRWKKDMIR